MILYLGVGALALAGGAAVFGFYVAGFRAQRRVRGLAALALFFSAMALWQLGVALVGGLEGSVQADVAYGAAFGLLGAIAQVAQIFRARRGDTAAA